jgi:hypothetical protein
MWRFMFLVHSGWFTKESDIFLAGIRPHLLKPLPVTIPLYTYQLSESRRGKVASDQSSVLCLYSVKKLSPGLSSQSLVHLENVAPVNLSQLSGMDGYITHNQSPLASRNNGQAHVVVD